MHILILPSLFFTNKKGTPQEETFERIKPLLTILKTKTSFPLTILVTNDEDE